MAFFLILVAALLFGVTPAAGASEAFLETSDVTRLRVRSLTDERNDISISSTGTADAPSILVTDVRGISAGGIGCTSVTVSQVSCPAAGFQLDGVPIHGSVRAVVVDLGTGDDVLTICGRAPRARPRCESATDLAYPPDTREAFVIARGDAGNDRLIGGAGRDDLKGGPGDDPMIAGEGGNDYLEMGVGPEDVDAADGQDDIDGGPGDDTIGTGPTGMRPPQGPDTISGGDGVDTADFSQRTQPLIIDLDGQADDGEAGEGANVRPDVEGVIGGEGDDTLTGSTAANVLDGRNGEDSIEGAAGDDILLGGGANDPGGDNLSGGSGNDKLFGASGDDSLDGGEGDDEEHGGGGGDRVEGGDGSDSLEGGAGADDVDGGDGNDRLDGAARSFVGGDANDNLTGGPGRDFILGGRGNDRLDGGAGPDDLNGQDGKDTVTYEDRTNPVFVTLDDEANDGELGEGDNVHSDVEVILGGIAGDDLSGDVDDNTLRGDTGQDLIDGTVEGGTREDLREAKDEADRLLAGDASDLVMARDDLPDQVACGDGEDLAIVDDKDKVINCETVDRQGSRVPVVGRYALLTPRGEVALRLPGGPRFFRERRFVRERRVFPPGRPVKIPIDSTIDPKGEVVLTTASDRGDGRKVVSASGAPFKLRQQGGRQPLTTLLLAGGLDCARASTQRGTANRAVHSSQRKLRTRTKKGKGRVNVRGRYSIGGSRDTEWITKDTCKGTLTTVISGTVSVEDLARGRKVTVRAGNSYLARARPRGPKRRAQRATSSGHTMRTALPVSRA
jgi:Ca2+-binding RTX toxin-like protein